MLIATPDIKSFEVSSELDFLVMGSDGIYEKQTNENITKAVWETSKFTSKNNFDNFHNYLGDAADIIL